MMNKARIEDIKSAMLWRYGLRSSDFRLVIDYTSKTTEEEDEEKEEKAEDEEKKVNTNMTIFIKTPTENTISLS
eukprot:9605064-Prorocentrum_lima.AAC.1